MAVEVSTFVVVVVAAAQGATWVVRSHHPRHQLVVFVVGVVVSVAAVGVGAVVVLAVVVAGVRAAAVEEAGGCRTRLGPCSRHR